MEERERHKSNIENRAGVPIKKKQMLPEVRQGKQLYALAPSLHSELAGARLQPESWSCDRIDQSSDPLWSPVRERESRH